jgi:hypothetical protein
MITAMPQHIFANTSLLCSASAGQQWSVTIATHKKLNADYEKKAITP